MPILDAPALQVSMITLALKKIDMTNRRVTIREVGVDIDISVVPCYEIAKCSPLFVWVYDQKQHRSHPSAIVFYRTSLLQLLAVPKTEKTI